MKKRFNFIASPQTSSTKSDDGYPVHSASPTSRSSYTFLNSGASEEPLVPAIETRTNTPVISRTKKRVDSLLIEARRTVVSTLASRFGIPAQDLLGLLGDKIFDDSLTGIEIGSVLARGFRKTRRVLDIDLHKVIRDLSLLKTILPAIQKDNANSVSLVSDVAEAWTADISCLLKKIGDIGSDKFVKGLIVDFIKNSTGTAELEQASFGQFYFGICLLEQSLMPIPGNPRGLLHLLSEQHRGEAEKRRSQILSIVSATKATALLLVTP